MRSFTNSNVTCVMRIMLASRYLFQRIDKHKHSATGKHLRVAHNQRNKDLQEQFTIRNVEGNLNALFMKFSSSNKET